MKLSCNKNRLKKFKKDMIDVENEEDVEELNAEKWKNLIEKKYPKKKTIGKSKESKDS